MNASRPTREATALLRIPGHIGGRYSPVAPADHTRPHNILAPSLYLGTGGHAMYRSGGTGTTIDLSGDNGGAEGRRGRPVAVLRECLVCLRGEGLVGYLLGVPVEADSADVLVFEVDRSEVSEDLVLASTEPDKVADRARVTLDEALTRLKPSLHKVVDLLKELAPDETEVEFGLKIGGEIGVIIAKGTAEVNFAIRMSWKSG